MLVPIACAAGCGDGAREDDAPAVQSAPAVTTSGIAADAYVRSGTPNRNYGTATALYSDKNDAGSVLQTYLRVSIGNVGTIASAKLRLYVTGATSGTHEVRLVSSNAWGETSLTWNNKPAVDGALITTIRAARAFTWIEIDVTSLARANTTFSLAVLPNTSDDIAFRSRQASSNRPQLVIEAAPPPDAGGPDAADASTIDAVDGSDAIDASETIDAVDVGDSASTDAASDSSPAIDAADPDDSKVTIDAEDPNDAGPINEAGETVDAGDPDAAADAPGADSDAGSAATAPNLKIALVADTEDGAAWASVLALVLQEGAQAVVVSGDMTYDDDPVGWWATTEGVVGISYPVFLSRGNHDHATWSGFLPKAADHLGDAVRIAGPHDAAYKTIFRGLSIATIKKGDTASTLDAFLNGDASIWKICNWHQNQNKMQVGSKGDEMGWGVYEACRQRGAIIVTAHEHSYHRTTTMTDTQAQTIDATCASGSSLCVGPGRTFVSVIGTGGSPIRSQVRCLPAASAPPFPSLNTTDPSCPIWASIYTTTQSAEFGAQFITFHVDGNPKKARGYFKTVSGMIVDSFDILAD